MGRLRVALAVLLLTVVAPAAPLATAGDPGAAGVLPTGRTWTAAAAHGDFIYVFGGSSGLGVLLDEILRYDPGSDTLTVMEARLPTPRDGMSAVSDGTSIYLFGGATLAGEVADILRYDPSGDTLTLVGQLPSTRRLTSAVWTGSEAYVFGGVTDQDTRWLDDVLRFRPDTADVDLVGHLPGRRAVTCAVWSGLHAYIFAGRNGGTYYNTVIQYTPLTNAAILMPGRLPTVRDSTSCVWALGGAYIFGGWGPGAGGTSPDDIIRYTPGLDALYLPQVQRLAELTLGFSPMDAGSLSPGRYGTSAALAPNGRAYVFGGWSGWQHLSDIYEYTPSLLP